MSILQRLSEITDLPTLPEVMLKIRAIITSDDGDAGAVARIVEQDPALASKILKIANSTFYSGNKNRISSVQFAISRIGFNEIGTIIMASSIIKKMSRKSDLLQYHQFWRHSLTAANLTVLAGRYLKTTGVDESALFLAGLLHDIGILLYDQFFHAEFEKIISYASAHELSFVQAEKAYTQGETHALIGSALLERWKLDSGIVAGVRFHDNPAKAPGLYQQLALSVYTAEYILGTSSLGTFEGAMPAGAAGQEGITRIGINPEMVPEFLEKAESEVNKSDMIFAFENMETT